MAVQGKGITFQTVNISSDNFHQKALILNVQHFTTKEQKFKCLKFCDKRARKNFRESVETYEEM